MNRRRQLASAALLAMMMVVGGCSERQVQADDASATADVTSDADGIPDAPPTDTLVMPDLSSRCGGAALALGFVTNSPTSSSSPKDLEVNGTVSYLGAVRVPLASSPQFKDEVEIAKTGGGSLIVQYFLPPGVKLPVRQGSGYTFTFIRRRVGNGLTAEAWVIERPTSGLPPLLMVAEPAVYGQAFDGSHSSITPLTVERLEQTQCPAGGSGCDEKATDRLRFTGGAATAARIEVLQGNKGTLLMLGTNYSAYNVASWHLTMPCPDAQFARAAFLVLIDAP